ncbi:MAG: oligosaccharide flippase family protein [Candidatus Nanopelagicales bacterium]
MKTDDGRLTAQERRSVLFGPLIRILTTPLVAVLGLVNTAIIVRETGVAAFGLVSLIATVTLFLPFLDLGVGATVINASAQLNGPSRDPDAADVIRRGYHVLGVVAAVVLAAAVCIMVANGWAAVVGFSTGPHDRWAITAAVCIFALTIPAGLGLRILVGLDRMPVAMLVYTSFPAFAVAVTLLLRWLGADGIWYSISSLSGVLIGEGVASVLALRISGLGWSAFARVPQYSGRRRLLAGSLWLFIVGVGVPVGLQGGRVILAHLSTPTQLSEYALMAQIYGIVWSALFTAGMVYWPVFLKRRTATEASVRMWWQLNATFGGLALAAVAGFVLLAPMMATQLSGGRIAISASLALGFGALLVAQSAHLASSVLLTSPDEARWQASCAVAMAALSIGLGCGVADRFGAVGVVWMSAVAILAAQVVPDFVWVPTLVRRRSRT